MRRPRVRRMDGLIEEAEPSQAHALELARWTQPARYLAGLSVSFKIFITPSSQLPRRRRTKPHACSVIIPQHHPECHVPLWVSAFVWGLSASQWLKAITSTIPLLLGSCHTDLCAIPTHLEHVCGIPSLLKVKATLTSLGDSPLWVFLARASDHVACLCFLHGLHYKIRNVAHALYPPSQPSHPPFPVLKPRLMFTFLKHLWLFHSLSFWGIRSCQCFPLGPRILYNLQYLSL